MGRRPDSSVVLLPVFLDVLLDVGVQEEYFGENAVDIYFWPFFNAIEYEVRIQVVLERLLIQKLGRLEFGFEIGEGLLNVGVALPPGTWSSAEKRAA